MANFKVLEPIKYLREDYAVGDTIQVSDTDAIEFMQDKGLISDKPVKAGDESKKQPPASTMNEKDEQGALRWIGRARAPEELEVIKENYPVRSKAVDDALEAKAVELSAKSK